MSVQRDNEIPAQDILPQDPIKATHDMISMSRGLLAIAERETQALAQNDLMSLAILQDEKERSSQRYQKASAEFRNRVEQFRMVDKSLIGQLEALQNQMNEVMTHNNQIVLQMRDKARQSTSETLITAQALGQEKIVTFGQRAWGAPETEATQITEQTQQGA